jgi:hypothetical protein
MCETAAGYWEDFNARREKTPPRPSPKKKRVRPLQGGDSTLARLGEGTSQGTGEKKKK